MAQWLQDKAELVEQIQQLEHELDEVKKQQQDTPTHLSWEDLPQEAKCERCVLSADVREGKKRRIGWSWRLQAVSVAGSAGRQAGQSFAAGSESEVADCAALCGGASPSSGDGSGPLAGGVGLHPSARGAATTVVSGGRSLPGRQPRRLAGGSVAGCDAGRECC
jgi:hypothetical protein